MSKRKLYSVVSLAFAFGVYTYGHFVSNAYIQKKYISVRQTVDGVQNSGDLSRSTLNTSESVDSLYHVVRVIDGDTIVVQIGDRDEKVRFIGIDTPETVDPRKPVQCFGKEASLKTKALLSIGQVRLVSDTSQGNRDKYGRLLRYLFLPDGTFVNKVLIEQGFAHEYTYRLPYQYQTEFKQAQNSAREKKLGLWADGVCGI